MDNENITLIEKILLSIKELPGEVYNSLADNESANEVSARLTTESNLIKAFILRNKEENSLCDAMELSVDLFSEIIRKRLFIHVDFNEPAEFNSIKLSHFLQISQCIRLLSRYDTIQRAFLEINHSEIINILSSSLSSMLEVADHNEVGNSGIVQQILIELIQIMRRFIFPKVYLEKANDFIENILLSEIPEMLVSCIRVKNEILHKILHYILLTKVNNKLILLRFNNLKDTTLSIVSSFDQEGSLSIIGFASDYLIELIEKSDLFREEFLRINGFTKLLSFIKTILLYYDNNNHLHSDYIRLYIKVLFIIQSLYKYKESLKNNENKELINYLITTLIFILREVNNTNSELNTLSTTIYNTISSLCLSEEISFYLKEMHLNWLLTSFLNKTLEICYPENTVVNPFSSNTQIHLIRIIRIVFSFEKNRKMIKKVFPLTLLSQFIEIGNYKPKLKSYENFIKQVNMLTKSDIIKIINATNQYYSITNEVVNDYTVLDLIGQGGFGDVYKVTKSNKTYALKLIKLKDPFVDIFKYNKSTKRIEESIWEVAVWKSLSHSNIVKYLSSFIIQTSDNKLLNLENGLYTGFVMEYIEGVNLSEYLVNLKEKNTLMKIDDIIRISLDLLCALFYLHSQGIIYNDLNPNNILLDYKLNVKVTDFGLSKKFIDNNQLMSESILINNLSSNLNNSNLKINYQGTIFYSSPEVIKGEPVDFASDLFSFGCVLYEMLTMKQPFTGDNPLTIGKRICELQYEHIVVNRENEKIVKVIEGCLKPSNTRITLKEIFTIFQEEFLNKYESVRQVSAAYNE